MFSRKRFFGLGFAIVGALLGSQALGAPPGAASVRFMGTKLKKHPEGPILEGEPLGGDMAQTECKAVFCASRVGTDPSLEHRLLQWHGPIHGYCYIGHEFAKWYEDTGILADFDLVECPSLNPSNRCFRLGMAGKMSAMPSGKSEFKSHAGQDRWDIRASDTAKWTATIHPVPVHDNTEQAIVASQDAEVAGWEKDFVHCPDGVCINSIPKDPFEPVAVSPYFGLFSFAGNWRVAQAVEAWKSMLSTCVKDYGVEHMTVDLVDIAKNHPEVFDTAVRERIMDSFGGLCMGDEGKTLALSKFLKANRRASQEFSEKYCAPLPHYPPFGVAAKAMGFPSAQ